MQKIHADRRFCNKIYQATKFVLGRFGEGFKPRATPSKTGNESLAERWILHKYSLASKEANEYLENREFNAIAQALRRYFYAELCDVFVENSKSLLEADAPAEAQESAKQTLYTALEGGLKLLHPIMPFLTEELWQRLPRREGDKTESIMIASYPTQNTEFDDPAAQTAYELILASSGTLRAMLGEFGFKTKGDFEIQPHDKTSFETLNNEIASIKSLGGKYTGNITVRPFTEGTTAPAPSGCASRSVSAQATVYLHVPKDNLLEMEGKAKTDLEKAREAVEKQRKFMGAAGFEKSPENVREAAVSKLADLEKGVEVVEEQIGVLERLRLE